MSVLTVYDVENKYRASCTFAEDAGALVAFLGDGATIRLGRSKKRVLWTEGAEDQAAAESYDYVAEVVSHRASPTLEAL